MPCKSTSCPLFTHVPRKARFAPKKGIFRIVSKGVHRIEGCIKRELGRGSRSKCGKRLPVQLKGKTLKRVDSKYCSVEAKKVWGFVVGRYASAAAVVTDRDLCRVTFLLTVYTRSIVQKWQIWAWAHGIAPNSGATIGTMQ